MSFSFSRLNIFGTGPSSAEPRTPDGDAPKNRPRPTMGAMHLALAILVLLAALPIAYMISRINDAFPQSPERAVQVVAACLSVLLLLPPSAYLVLRRRSADPARLGLITLTTVGVLAVSIYLFWVSHYVRFPADILIWSESDFVNDILKVRVGYPLYTAQQNNESSAYPPGTQMLTYLLAWLLGNASSIPVYRAIQLGYALMAALVATLCCRRLVSMSFPSRPARDAGWWTAAWLPILFLFATNPLTNPFVHNLHDDSLAQLVSVAAYWLLLRYVSRPSARLLALMAVVPALGFVVKQSLVVWAPLYCLQLALFDRPRSVRRLVGFALAASVGVGAVVGGGYLLWGEPFTYWTFTVLRSHGVSLLRSFQHGLDVWSYLVIGLVGGFVLLRSRNLRTLLGPWLVWLILVATEIYSSGIAWMLNHIGPGSLIAGIWFVTALARLWPKPAGTSGLRGLAQSWVQAGLITAMTCLLLGGLGLVRIPLSPLPSDAYRYVAEIEREFEGQGTEILLDMGTWVYARSGIVMKDRVVPFGDRGYAGIGDFSGMLGRLEQKQYSRILVRNLHSADFVYDHWMWSRSSGIREALLDHYDEVGTIEAVSSAGPLSWSPPYGFCEISILAPKQDRTLP